MSQGSVPMLPGPMIWSPLTLVSSYHSLHFLLPLPQLSLDPWAYQAQSGFTEAILRPEILSPNSLQTVQYLAKLLDTVIMM